ncbi:MAG TPA: hypothetical protein DGG95_09125 [Cytophagales bacterium]|jgi:MFS transporter, PPP family, 3-phenylpropionic acid transporter|nr:hypothetical protein [Cytophagales bacterium]
MSPATILRVLYFLFFCCTAAFIPRMADFCLNRGLTHGQISLVLSITPVMMFAVQPFYGMMADKLGYKKTVLISSLIASVSYLGYLASNSFLTIVATTVIMSAFYNTLQPVLDSIALRLSERDPNFSYGSLRVFGAVGWMIANAISGHFIDATDIRAIFIVSFLSMFLVFVFSIFLSNESAETQQPGFSQAFSVLKNRQLMVLLLCVFIVSFGATTIWNYYSTFMKEKGASDTLVGYALSFHGFCELPFFYFSARIIFKLGLKTTFVITAFATSLRMFLYSITSEPLHVIPIELLQGLSWSLFWAVSVEFVNRVVDGKWLATGQSLLYAVYFGIGQIAGNYWTGYFHSRGMTIARVFLMNAALTFVAVIIAWIFLTKEKVTDSGTTQA